MLLWNVAKLWIMTNLSFKQNIIVIFHLHKALGDSTEKIISLLGGINDYWIASDIMKPLDLLVIIGLISNTKRAWIYEVYETRDLFVTKVWNVHLLYCVNPAALPRRRGVQHYSNRDEKGEDPSHLRIS